MPVTSSAIGTLVVFVFSIIFVIRPLSSITIRVGRSSKKLRIPIHLNLNTAPIGAIAILWAAQCLGKTEIRRGIVGTDGVKPYNILILFFSLAYMAITLDITGILKAAAYWVSNKGGTNGWRLFIYFYIMLTVLSVLLGNDPVILSGTMFLVYYTNTRKLAHMPWIMSEFAAANTASMVLFVGNPTNVVICEGFGVNNVAFTAYTILPFLACSVFCLAVLAFQFRKNIHSKLEVSEKLEISSVLHDPKGALVGSILLGTCLAVIIIVSFFRVDVWKISLPFAFAKFLFDLVWDQYRPRPDDQVSPENELPNNESELETPADSMDDGKDDVENARILLQDDSTKTGSRFDQDNVPTAVPNDLEKSRTDSIEGIEVGKPLGETKTSDFTLKPPKNDSAMLPCPVLASRIVMHHRSSHHGVRSNTEDSAKSDGTVKTEETEKSDDSEKTEISAYSKGTELTAYSKGTELSVYSDDVADTKSPSYLKDLADTNVVSQSGDPVETRVPSNLVDSPDSRKLEDSASKQTIESDKQSDSSRTRFLQRIEKLCKANFPTIHAAFPRLPFALIPFAFSQFILIEALAHQGWIDIFARWLIKASGGEVFKTVWLVGVLGVVLCNISGTNIGATILLTKIVRASSMPDQTVRAAAIALAVASNIGAVSFTFSASLAGLLWQQILEEKGKGITQREFAKYNFFPLLTMTAVGLGVVSAEMAVLYGG